jgi:hypothetical protein
MTMEGRAVSPVQPGEDARRSIVFCFCGIAYFFGWKSRDAEFMQ